MLRFGRYSRHIGILLFALPLLAPVLAHAQVAFVKDFNDALKQAAKERKFVILDISASW